MEKRGNYSLYGKFVNVKVKKKTPQYFKPKITSGSKFKTKLGL